ncbi:MAG: O-antigen ligase family protein [Bacteroidetes bacterium]|nr:O-antigen ligase family protein [Bacteroidota bacterium]
MKGIKEFFRGFTVSDYLFVFVLLTMCWSVKYAPIGICILVVVGIKNWVKSTSLLQSILDWKSPSFWLMLFFIWHVIGLLWTDNFRFAWSDIGMKIHFLFVPFILASVHFSFSKNKALQLWIWSLALTVVANLLFSSVQSIYYPEDNHWGFFLESEFSHWMHRSYYGTYTALAAITVLFLKPFTFKRVLWGDFGVFVLLSFATFLTGSKAAFLLIFLGIGMYLLRVLKNQKRSPIKLILGTLVSIGILVLVLPKTTVGLRLAEIPKALKNMQTAGNNDVETNASRLIVWSTSYKLITEKYWLTGAGTGDGKDELISKNYELGNIGVADKKLNSHNQYLNSWLQLGLVGIFSLLMIFVTSIRIGFQKRSVHELCLSIGLMITFLFESFIETQAGIIPFCVLICLLSLKSEPIKLSNV